MEKEEKKLSTGAIIGIILGGIFVGGCLLEALYNQGYEAGVLAGKIEFTESIFSANPEATANFLSSVASIKACEAIKDTVADQLEEEV